MCRNIKTLHNFAPPATDERDSRVCPSVRAQVERLRTPVQAERARFQPRRGPSSPCGARVAGLSRHQRPATGSRSRGREGPRQGGRPVRHARRSVGWVQRSADPPLQCVRNRDRGGGSSLSLDPPYPLPRLRHRAARQHADEVGAIGGIGVDVAHHVGGVGGEAGQRLRRPVLAPAPPPSPCGGTRRCCRRPSRRRATPSPVCATATPTSA